MNGERYLNVLQHHLLPCMKIHKSTWFLQDGTLCHTSKLVMGRLKEFQVMDWPGNSPDLNPIENFWSFMKYKLKSDRAVTSLPKMIQALKMMLVIDMHWSTSGSCLTPCPGGLRRCWQTNATCLSTELMYLHMYSILTCKYKICLLLRIPASCPPCTLCVPFPLSSPGHFKLKLILYFIIQNYPHPLFSCTILLLFILHPENRT
jgi:hypothetical protein